MLLLWESKGMLSLRRRVAGLLILGAAVVSAFAQTNQVIYPDSLQNGWQNWSWATVNFSSSAVTPHSGSSCISVTSDNWEALYLHHNAQSGSVFSNLTFWIHGGTGGQTIHVQAQRNGSPQSAVVLAPLPAGTWREEVIPLTALGVANVSDFDGFWLQVQSPNAEPTFYVDDIVLIGGTNIPPPQATNSLFTVTINATLNQHAINPMIYGVAFASASQLSELNSPLNRSGGNTETRYNWQLNTHNRGADWYFQSLPDSPATAGAATDDHITQSKDGGAAPMVTVPMLGWVPKLGPGRGRLSSYSIAKYGPQTGSDAQWFPDAGNGISTSNNSPITWNDPNDANLPTNSLFQQTWVCHLTNRWGVATNGGVRYYCMDNEHTLWHSTHRDVHPVGTTMQEIRAKLFDYGTKVKAVDPNAVLAAPEEWGWPGYLYSGFDWQWADNNSNWNPANFPDRATNGGWDYGPWLLDQARRFEQTNGTRVIDIFTLHIYPQGDGQFSDNTSAATQLGRNRSTRALWDTNYVDESWIDSVIKLIPRMKEWVATFYPGTKIGITEYNWGAEGHINGATAHADIYGIFGREGLDYATRWTTPNPTTPTFKAMKMYRNYDGNKSTFGDTSVAASGPNPDLVSCFAATRSTDGDLTVMAINKQMGTNAPVRFALTNFSAIGTAQVWQLTSANTITRLADVSFTGGIFTNTLPAQSVT
jgi:hypothetical protein